jgi:hypothetical protein
MEKIIAALQRADADESWCTQLRTEVADRLLDTGLPGLTVHVRDDAVRASLMTLTTLDPPVVAFVSMWADQYYGEQVRAAFDVIEAQCEAMSAYLVTESVPMAPPVGSPGERTDGLANIALLRRPTDLDEPTWLQRWHFDHTPVAIATQATFGYVQNTVVRPITADAPHVSAIVEELFPLQAVSDLHAFFGAADDADLSDRMQRMLASTSAFGASQDVDTVPTSRYAFRSPFRPEVSR